MLNWCQSRYAPLFPSMNRHLNRYMKAMQHAACGKVAAIENLRYSSTSPGLPVSLWLKELDPQNSATAFPFSIRKVSIPPNMTGIVGSSCREFHLANPWLRRSSCHYIKFKKKGGRHPREYQYLYFKVYRKWTTEIKPSPAVQLPAPRRFYLTFSPVIITQLALQLVLAVGY